ncbi:MAG TPA: response regulator [Vicinamibacteria bacterium]|nr:response regulator [Vicinamibacteria bacterium]
MTSVLTGLNVLVIEDHDDSREALSRYISGRGANVFAAENGRRALRIASVNPLDLVLCDLTMPVMDGYQFVREFRARECGRHIPVFAVSALPEESASLDAVRAGFDGYVSKPIDLRALEARIAVVRAEVARAAERATAALDRAEVALNRSVAAHEEVIARMLRTKKRIEK